MNRLQYLMDFSVIVPLYNKSKYISRCINSIFNQSLSAQEIIVVDDGSTDESVAILQDLNTRNNNKLNIIEQSNMGGAGGQARNTGMKIAKCKWFAFLDADDCWLPNHLEELSKLISYAGKPILASTKTLELKTGLSFEAGPKRASIFKKVNYFEEAGKSIHFINCSSVAIHRDIYKNVGGFQNFKSGPDLHYWARVALAGYECFTSNTITSIYYRGNFGNMEVLEANSKTKKISHPKNIGDVSPSLYFLMTEINNDPELLNRQDIRAYINGRIKGAMLINIRRSNPLLARSFYSLTVKPRDFTLLALNIAAHLPTKALRILNNVYSARRKLFSTKSDANKTQKHTG